MSCIRLEDSLRPLTDEEREFAGEHFEIIHKAMRHYSIYDDECFDELLFYYFNAVQRWFTEPELHQWEFNAIAYKTVEGGIKFYRKKKATRAVPLSLDATPSEDSTCEYYEAWTEQGSDNIEAIFIDCEEIERAAAKHRMIEQIKKRLTARQLEIAATVGNGISYLQAAKMLGLAKGSVCSTMFKIKKMVEHGELVYSR